MRGTELKCKSVVLEFDWLNGNIQSNSFWTFHRLYHSACLCLHITYRLSVCVIVVGIFLMTILQDMISQLVATYIFFSESLNHSLTQATHSKYHYNALLGDMHQFMYGIIFIGGGKIVMLCIKCKLLKRLVHQK